MEYIILLISIIFVFWVVFEHYKLIKMEDEILDIKSDVKFTLYCVNEFLQEIESKIKED